MFRVARAGTPGERASRRAHAVYLSLLAAALLLITVLQPAGVRSGRAASLDTFSVSSTSDAGSSCAGVPAPGGTATEPSLRCAISDANADTSTNGVLIGFAIPSTDAGCSPLSIGSRSVTVCVIQPTSGADLPALTRANTTIDGYTQTSAIPNTVAMGSTASTVDNAAVTIWLFGGATDASGNPVNGTNGLTLSGSGETVRGLAITNYAGYGIVLAGATHATIEGDFLGLDPRGLSFGNGEESAPGGGGGVDVAAGSVADTIGGTSPDAVNLISGNDATTFFTGDGIDVAGASGTVVEGNIVGVDTKAQGAGNLDGIYIAGSSNTTVGGTSAATANVIGGNAGNGVEISGGSGTLVTGNRIGVDFSGTAIGNDGVGALIAHASTANRIGATADSSGSSANVIMNNGGAGIQVGASATDRSRVGIFRNLVYANNTVTKPVAPEITVGSQTITTCGAGPMAGAPNDGTPCATVTSASTSAISGTACAGCVVDVYTEASAGSDPGLGGDHWLGEVTAAMPAGTSGCTASGGLDCWTLSAPFAATLDPTWQAITATASLPISGTSPTQYETSEFGPSCCLSSKTWTVVTTGDGFAPTAPCQTASGAFIGTTQMTLRCALTLANLGQNNTVTFAIAAGSAGCLSTDCVVQPASPLPVLSASGLTVNGYGQAGSTPNTLPMGTTGTPVDNAVIHLHLDGASVTSGAGLTLSGQNQTVQGVSITRFGVGVELTGATGAKLTGSFIGLQPSGSAVAGNGTGIEILAGGSDTIGGSSAAAINLISGNGGDGLYITSAGATIAGNYIGVDRAGAAAGNGAGAFLNNSSGVTIAPNVIGGNAGDGVDLYGDSGDVLTGNRIGISFAGVPLPNGGNGITVEATARNDALGAAGDTTGASANSIANNGGSGVLVGNSPTDHSHVAIYRNLVYNNNTSGGASNLEIRLNGQSAATCSAAGSAAPNDGVRCPIISTLTSSQAAGTACSGCVVDVYFSSNGPQDANSGGSAQLLGETTATGSCTPSPCPSGSSGWTVSASIPAGFPVTATATTPASPGPVETSEFAQNKSLPLTVSLGKGWNLLDEPLWDPRLDTASALATTLDATGQLGSSTAVAAVATYTGGSFTLYVPGYSADVPLAASSGIFVLSAVAGSWHVAGGVYPAPPPVGVRNGWNLASAPLPAAGLAPQTIHDEIASQSGGSASVTEIATYVNGSGYQSWRPGSSSNTLSQVPATAGMWILCNCAAPTRWTPH